VKTAPVSRESVLTKPGIWSEFLALADLLMTSSQANVAGTAASEDDDLPETHAEVALCGPAKKSGEAARTGAVIPASDCQKS